LLSKKPDKVIKKARVAFAAFC